MILCIVLHLAGWSTINIPFNSQIWCTFLLSRIPMPHTGGMGFSGVQKSQLVPQPQPTPANLWQSLVVWNLYKNWEVISAGRYSSNNHCQWQNSACCKVKRNIGRRRDIFISRQSYFAGNIFLMLCIFLQTIGLRMFFLKDSQNILRSDMFATESKLRPAPIRVDTAKERVSTWLLSLLITSDRVCSSLLIASDRVLI